jgi:hypothetical protein
MVSGRKAGIWAPHCTIGTPNTYYGQWPLDSASFYASRIASQWP